MFYTEDSILHITTIRTNPNAVLILYLQKYLVCRLCGWMEWRYCITQTLKLNISGYLSSSTRAFQNCSIYFFSPIDTRKQVPNLPTLG